MKKIALLSMVFCMSSLIAAAASSPEPKQVKEPKKKEESSSFALSKGYFSLFNVFIETRQQADTLRKAQPQPGSRK